jgi:hypothetical protein
MVATGQAARVKTLHAGEAMGWSALNPIFKVARSDRSLPLPLQATDSAKPATAILKWVMRY